MSRAILAYFTNGDDLGQFQGRTRQGKASYQCECKVNLGAYTPGKQGGAGVRIYEVIVDNDATWRSGKSKRLGEQLGT